MPLAHLAGLLSLLVAPYPRGPMVVPVAWCLVGAQAAALFDVQPALALLVAGVQGLVLLCRNRLPAPTKAAAPIR